jgi:tight adherence protein C
MRLVMIAAAGVGLVLGGAQPGLADDPVRINVDQIDASGFPLVRVITSVTDSRGKSVGGLEGSEVHLLEAGVAQSAVVELASEDAPVALALALDTSGSMAGRPFVAAKAAVISLIERLGPADQASLVTFNATARIAQSLTGDVRSLVAATEAAAAGGDTAIYDAVALAVDTLAASRPDARRAVVLLTDGVDTSSKSSAASAVSKLAASGMPVHVIALGPSLDMRVLADLTRAAPGGQLFEAPSSTQLAGIYAGLAERLRTQYSVSYRSNAIAGDGATIGLEISLRRGASQLGLVTLTYQVPAGKGTATSVRPSTTVPSAAPPVQRDAVNVPIGAPPERQLSLVVALLGVATTLTLLIWIAELASMSPQRERRRLEQFVRRLTVTATEHKRRSIVQRIIVPSFRTVGRPLLRITPAGMLTSTRQRLLVAGEPMGLGPAEFLGVRSGFALVFAVVMLLALTRTSATAPWIFMLAAMAATVGYTIPGFAVDALGRARKDAVRKALPASLDMIALSVEAGLSFDGAIAQVAQRWNTPLSDELRRLLVEFQMGRDRRQAMREMAERSGVPELIRFVNSVGQADALGVPLAKVVQEQSAEMRTGRRQRAETAARTAPVKMLFPMVLLIFPALFVVILGPAVPRLMEMFRITY